MTLHRFDILEVLGAGAFGIVCVARPAGQEGEAVALKVLRADQASNEKAASRLRDEARLLLRLAHPNILDGRELLEVDGRPVMVTEWVKGVSLDRLMREFPKGLPSAIALDIVRRIASALDAAYHAEDQTSGQPLRVVHRDIKPANVLLGVDGALKVVDFGIAKGDLEERETHSQAIVFGSRGFMAPERLDGEADHPAVDVYALSMTAFQLLTSRVLSLSPRPELHASKLRHNLELMPLTDVPEFAQAQLRELLYEMAEYEPEDRPTAAAVVERVDELLEAIGETVDLISFARRHVQPLWVSRQVEDPRGHKHFSDLAFLGEAVDVSATSPADAKRSDARVRAFLEAEDWASHRDELEALLADNPGWTEGPFLEVVERAKRPWWRFWQARPQERELQTAMEMLLYRCSPEVVERCRPLAQHADARVAEAALTLLERSTALPRAC